MINLLKLQCIIACREVRPSISSLRTPLIWPPWLTRPTISFWSPKLYFLKKNNLPCCSSTTCTPIKGLPLTNVPCKLMNENLDRCWNVSKRFLINYWSKQAALYQSFKFVTVFIILTLTPNSVGYFAMILLGWPWLGSSYCDMTTQNEIRVNEEKSI